MLPVVYGRYREFVGRPRQGSKDPVFVECDMPAFGAPMRWTTLVKPSAEVAPQVREYLGNLLASEFGLHTPMPYIVRFEVDDQRALRRHYDRERRFLPQVPPELAGSLKVRLGTNVPIATSLDPDLVSPACRLFAFDMLTHYADRTEANPNCSWSGEGLLVFDFEQCCPPDPRFMEPGPIWTPCARGLAPVHLLTRHLQGRNVDLSFLRASLQHLADAEWRNLVEELPVTWHDEAHRMLDHVATVADHAAEFENDLREGLR